MIDIELRIIVSPTGFLNLFLLQRSAVFPLGN
jgi:hypothetical protein